MLSDLQLEDSLIPASKISNLSQGMFVGTISDNFGESIEQKIFHVQIVVDNDKIAEEAKAYQPIPVIDPFLDANGNDIMQQQIERNYNQIKRDVSKVIEDEKARIKEDPQLRRLFKDEE